MALGAFTFVLHSHLPYARLAGRWPHGEAWIHEAACDTIIPLLQTLYDLKEDGVDYRLTLSLSPVLLEQLMDPVVLEHFEQYLDAKIAAAERDVQHFATGDPAAPSDTADPHLHYMASWYRDWYASINLAYIKRFRRDIVGAFKHLQDSGTVEIVTSAATHAYLPLLKTDASVRAQIKTAVASYERCFGRKPAGIWLPELGYRPGLERYLAEAGLKVFFSETHAVTGGQPVGVAAGDVLGSYGRVRRHYVLPATTRYDSPRRDATTYKAYHVEGDDIAVMGRDNRTVQQVWSVDWGYPGDFDYREFNKKAGTSGLHYWRVTGAKTDLAHKDYYHPEWAAYKIDQHAEHFAHLVGDLLRDYNNDTGEFGLIASTYDTALFGQLWFEGVNWLGKVLRHLAQNPDVELTTASDYLREHPPQESVSLPESSWGAGGGHFAWDNGETHWMWQPVHEAEARMVALVAAHSDPDEAATAVLNQAARELLLLQASDWPFQVTTGRGREYAIQRFTQHVDRFNQLADSLDAGAPDADLADQFYKLDTVFPDMDYRWFAEG